jgi:hypothetical protein
MKLMPQAGQNSLSDWLQAIALVPLIRVLGDIAKMHGYPIGWLWRLRHHPPDWHQMPVSKDAVTPVAQNTESQ